MARAWYVAQAVGGREVAASVAATALGFPSFLPLLPVYRRIGHRLVETSVPRFGVYLFLNFDREMDPWADLMRDNSTHHPHPKYFRRILCDADGIPVPVPEDAMDAVKAFKPPVQEIVARRRYQPGEKVICTIAGVRREAVFVSYCGSRPMVKTWIFGALRTTEVRAAELEPIDSEKCLP